MSGPIGVAKCGYSIFSQARKMTICNMARTPRSLQLNRPSLDGAPMESARQVPHTTHRTRQQPPYDSRCNDYARLRTGALLGAVRSGCSKNPSFYRPKHLIRRVSTVRSLGLCRKRLSIILVLFGALQELLSPWAFLPLVLPAISPWRGVQILSIGGAKWAESSTRMPAVTDSFSWYLHIPSRGLNA